jgi:hypothetical protein
MTRTCKTCGVEAPQHVKQNWKYCGSCRNEWKIPPSSPRYRNHGKFCPVCGSRKAVPSVTCGRKKCMKKVPQAKKSGAKYGLSSYQVLLLRKTESCECCGMKFDGDGSDRHIDHDHLTGRARGVLCRWCNLTVGHSQEDEQRLLACVEYLRATKNIRGYPGAPLGGQ